MIRYKRADVFEKQLHGLFIYRVDDNGVRRDLPWRGNDEGKMAYPTHLEYEKFELNNPTRYWWTNGFDPKWYLSPFPSTEVNNCLLYTSITMCVTFLCCTRSVVSLIDTTEYIGLCWISANTIGCLLYTSRCV